MAARHNEYGRLLGTVENNIVPLKEQQGNLPAANVPDIGMIAEDCQMMGDALHKHADRLRAMSDMQPNFEEQFSGADSALGGF